MKLLTSLFLLILIVISCTNPPEISQWRGPERDGVYPEQDLLKVWPDAGPELLWDIDFIGDGFGSPVITSNGIYVSGAIDSTGYLFALNLDGTLKWKKTYGKEWVKNFPGSRSAPTVYNDLIYTCSGMGEVMCLNKDNGDILWRINMLEDLNGINTVFGFSQSVMVDEKNVYCSPGGKDTNVVALNRLTGDLVWISKALGEKSGFCSPQIFSYADKKMLITYSEMAVLALDIENGDLLWTYKNDSTGNVHSNTPILNGNHIFLVDGDGNKAVKLKLAEDGLSVSEVWRNNDLDNVMGGFVPVNDHLVATGHSKKYLKSLHQETGMITDSLKIGRGSTIYADSMIYLYNERGQVHLVKETNGKLTQVSTFKLTKGTKQHFSHPVIKNGILYIRHGQSLMAYTIKDTDPNQDNS